MSPGPQSIRKLSPTMSESLRLDTIRKSKLKARADADQSVVEELKKAPKKPARKAYEDLDVFRRIYTAGPMESFPILITSKPNRRSTNQQVERERKPYQVERERTPYQVELKPYWPKEPLSRNSKIWGRPRSRRLNEETSEGRDRRVREWMGESERPSAGSA